MDYRKIIIEELNKEYESACCQADRNKVELYNLYFDGKLCNLTKILTELSLKHNKDFLFETKYGSPKKSTTILGNTKIKTIISFSEKFSIVEIVKIKDNRLITLSYS